MIDILRKYEMAIEVASAIAIGLLLFFYMGTNAVILFIATLCVTILVNQMLRFWKKKNIDDERAWIQATYASLNSLITSAIIILGIQLSVVTRMIADIPSAMLLGIVNAIIFITFIGWYAYYYIKGYVD